MAKAKETLKTVGKWTGECVKRSLISLVMYVSVSIVIFMFTFQNGSWTTGLTTGRFWLCFVLGLAAVAYSGVTAFVAGGSGYDMLVAGNIKRTSSEDGLLKMSSHKEHKEYRVWKGFAIGGVAGLITVIFALIWGGNQEAIYNVLALGEKTTSPMSIRVMMFISMFMWGWAILPFLFINAGGAFVSYYLILPVALLPVAVSGVFYIVGAYSKRKKKLEMQEAELRALEEEASKPKKVNYGGLPGSKPKKKK